MNKFWKWAAIIFGALLVIALIALPFVLRFLGPRLAGYGRMGGFFGPGFFFGGLMSFVMFLVPMALILLAVVGLIAVIRAAARPPQPPPPPYPPANQGGAVPPAPGAAPYMQAPPAPPAASPSQPVAPAQPGEPSSNIAMRNCAACGRSIQADWVACPYCGQKVSY